MRFVWAVAAFVLAALMIGAGIAQRTVFEGPTSETASISVEEDAPYLLIDAAVLNQLSSPKLRSDNQRIQALYVSALGRIPTRAEYAKIEKVMRQAPSPVVAYQDLYWALLNSNEFVLNH